MWILDKPSQTPSCQRMIIFNVYHWNAAKNNGDNSFCTGTWYLISETYYWEWLSL